MLGGASKNILELKTVQTNSFRTLIEALKEILTDANIEFDETGMKIRTMDGTHTVFVHLKLNASDFDHYVCEEKYTIGVNMLNFFKLIKTMNNSDTLMLYIESESPEKLGIRIENGDKNSVTEYKLSLMDINEEAVDVNDVDFDSVLTMPSTDFQKIIRDMNGIADIVDIKSYGKTIVFYCKGDFCTQLTRIGENSTSGLSFSQVSDENQIVQGLFSLKYLFLFTKCTNLCNSIMICMKNDFPIIILYKVGDLGDIKLCLAPRVNEM